MEHSVSQYQHWGSMQFSFYRRPASNLNPCGEITLAQVVKYIKEYSPAKENTQKLRAMTNPDERKEFKKWHFDYVTFSGTFSRRSTDNLKSHSGLLVLDFDDLNDSLPQAWDAVLANPYFPVLVKFISPTGKGMKCVIPIDLSIHDHGYWFTAVANYIDHELHLKVDRSGRDVSRACFLPHDPDCYLHPMLCEGEDAQKDNSLYCFMDFDVDYWHDIDKPTAKDSSACYYPIQQNAFGEVPLQERVLKTIEALRELNVDISEDYNEWVRLGFAFVQDLGETGRDLYHELCRLFPGYDAAECNRKYDNFLKTNDGRTHIGTFFWMAKQAGVDLSEISRELLRSKTFCSDCSIAQLPMNIQSVFKPLNMNNVIDNDALDAQVSNEQSEQNNALETNVQNTTFSDKVTPTDWPSVLHPILDLCDTVEQTDKMLLSSLVVMSAMLPNYYGIYDQMTVFPPLYLIVYGDPSSGKGELKFAARLIEPLRLRMERQYKQEMAEYELEHADWVQQGEDKHQRAYRGPEPQCPQHRDPLIAANSTATAFYTDLSNNGGEGLMFAPEADQLTQMLNSEYGNYSTGLRQAFHHERISLNRVRDHLHIDIPEPKLAVLLSCTPGQLPKLFPSFENGLGSRFLFYQLLMHEGWRNPFAVRATNKPATYDAIGARLLELYDLMTALGQRRIEFSIGPDQVSLFNDFFNQLHSEQLDILGDDICSFIRRLGVSTFRFAMVLSLLRRYSEWDRQQPFFLENQQSLVCRNVDFQLAMTIANTLANHTIEIYKNLAPNDISSRNPRLAVMSENEKRFFLQLNDEFTTEDMNNLAEKERISKQTARRYMKKFCADYHVVMRVKNGVYKKIENAR